jgi:hypothetical protein
MTPAEQAFWQQVYVQSMAHKWPQSAELADAAVAQLRASLLRDAPVGHGLHCPKCHGPLSPWAGAPQRSGYQSKCQNCCLIIHASDVMSMYEPQGTS